MAEDTATAKPVTAISRTAARLSFASAATFAVLLAALHLIKRELDPSWHFISEYAIGNHGWMMALAFLSLALSYVSLFVAIRSQLRTIVGRIGLALVAFVVSFFSLGVMVSQSGGKFGPDVLVGWPNRFEILAYCVWLMTVAWQAVKLRRQ